MYFSLPTVFRPIARRSATMFSGHSIRIGGHCCLSLNGNIVGKNFTSHDISISYRILFRLLLQWLLGGSVDAANGLFVMKKDLSEKTSTIGNDCSVFIKLFF